ncbi:MAG TPA: hypothetical protein VHB20_05240 [Verrucomicrobiae bacterium]|jgi:hypothetical protein|nr:hypothetical protein [Verrucomicrobiae bacterium]
MNATFEAELRRGQRAAWAVATVGALLCALAAVWNRQAFFVSYLFGWLFWLGLTLGCLLVTMIHHLTSGRWGEVTRRYLEAGIAALPVMALLFIPILFGLRELYPWARPAEVAVDAVLQKRTGYANAWGFAIRSIVILACWVWMGVCLRRWSKEQDATRDLTPTRKLRRLSGVGVVIYVLTATLAYVDWMMSVEAKWYSTMFPIIVCIGQILEALAFVILAAAWERRDDVTEKHLSQLGNLLLAFVLFWTYVSFGQLLIIYSGNLPAEIGWYLHRIAGGWKWAVIALAVFRFFVPFYALLFRPIKRRMGRLAVIAGMVFVTGIADIHWCVAPTFYPHGFHVGWQDAAAWAGLGGIWFGIFSASYRRHPFPPRNDPRLEAAHASS